MNMLIMAKIQRANFQLKGKFEAKVRFGPLKSFYFQFFTYSKTERVFREKKANRRN